MYLFVIAQGHVMMERICYARDGAPQWTGTLGLPWVRLYETEWLRKKLSDFRVQYHAESNTAVIDAGERALDDVTNRVYDLNVLSVMLKNCDWRPIVQFAEAARDPRGYSEAGAFALEPEAWVKHRQAVSLLRSVGVLPVFPIIPWLAARETGGRRGQLPQAIASLGRPPAGQPPGQQRPAEP